jgi:hypothetical protein
MRGHENGGKDDEGELTRSLRQRAAKRNLAMLDTRDVTEL